MNKLTIAVLAALISSSAWGQTAPPVVIEQAWQKAWGQTTPVIDIAWLPTIYAVIAAHKSNAFCIAKGWPWTPDDQTNICPVFANDLAQRLDAVYPNFLAPALPDRDKAPWTQQVRLCTNDGCTGPRVDRLSSSEFDRLEAARKALADAELEIAKAHGVDTVGAQQALTLTATGRSTFPEGWPRPPDTYRFSGRFLLINLPDAK